MALSSCNIGAACAAGPPSSGQTGIVSSSETGNEPQMATVDASSQNMQSVGAGDAFDLVSRAQMSSTVVHVTDVQRTELFHDCVETAMVTLTVNIPSNAGNVTVQVEVLIGDLLVRTLEHSEPTSLRL